MIRVAFGCDGVPPGPAKRCQFYEAPDHVNLSEADGWISAMLKENGWVTVGDKHFCPEHNPAAKGTPVQIHAGAYTEIAPGVNVRMPVGSYVQELMIEVQRAVPAEVRTAVETLTQQREEDTGPGRYDMVDQTQIDALINYVASGFGSVAA